MKKIIWGDLFTGKKRLGPDVSEGFYLVVKAGDIPTVRKNSMRTDLKKLTQTMRKVLLTGDAIMEAEEFLSHCNVLDTMDDGCIQCFKDHIKEMTHMERLRLCKFVTLFEFLQNNQARITREPSSRTDFALPKTSTCANSFSIPSYPNKEMMKGKLIVCSFSKKSYGLR